MSHRPNQLENYALWEQYNPRTGNWAEDTRNILLRFLQDLFYQMPISRGDDGSLLHYDRDETKTQLVISSAGKIDTATVGTRPAILVSRGPVAWANLSFDQFLGRNGRTGERTHTDMLNGSFVINCISRNGLEAERIAVLVMRGIRVYKRELQKAGFFRIGEQVQMGDETPADSFLRGGVNEDYINVPVYVPMFYQDSWKVSKEAILLESIVLRMHAVLYKSNGDPFYPDSFNNDGTINESSDGVTISAWTVSSS